MRSIAVIGAPSSAGAFAPGQEDAPAALRAAGLVDLLSEAGFAVEDYGDVRGFRWFPDREHPRAMHRSVVKRVALDVADRVVAAHADGRLALVLGGDCTVGLGTYLGVRRNHDVPWLIYLDPHPDLNTPVDSTSGALDWMGNAHLIGLPGAVPELVGLGDVPPLTPDRLILLDASPTRSQPAETDAIETLGIHVFAEGDVVADPAGVATRAAALVGDAPYLVHFDSDCIDFADLPICENTDRNVGLAHDTAVTALAHCAAGPALQALTVTEVNPHHGASDGATIATFTRGLVDALIEATQITSAAT